MFKLHYFQGKLNSGFVSLYSGRMIQFIGGGLLNLFLPIFLLQLFALRIELVFLFYLAGYIGYALLLPWGAKMLNKIGLRRSLIISIFFAAAYYLCFFLVNYNVSVFIALAVIMIVIFRNLFWYPFHIDLAKFTDFSNRGKEISLIWATRSFLTIIMPIIAGLLISFFGFNLVFIIAIIIYLVSIIPFMALPRTKETFVWGYLETFKRFFSKKNRKLVVANLANGAENGVAIIIWPIFIWQLLKGNYISVGAVSSLIVLATVLLQLVVGKYTDIFNKRKMIRLGSLFYASGWLIKIFVLSSFQIFIAGAYHGFTAIFKDTPFDTLNYEILADHGHYVDEYTVIKELAVQSGKILILIFAILVVFNFGLNWTFALAALASLFINFL
jgi:YQGE family putative transporter